MLTLTIHMVRAAIISIYYIRHYGNERRDMAHYLYMIQWLYYLWLLVEDQVITYLPSKRGIRRLTK